jgi:hypothetical protein
LATHLFARRADAYAVDHPQRDLERPELENLEVGRRHEVEFCANDACFVDGFASFIEAALRMGHAAIVIATEPHRISLLQKLTVKGVHVGAAIEQKSYISLDVVETLATFMLNDWPDPVRFMKVAHGLITEAAMDAHGCGRHVAACGECAPSLLAKGKVEAAIQLEHLWDQIASNSDVDILCGYALNDFRDSESSHVFQRICAEHSAVHAL